MTPFAADAWLTETMERRVFRWSGQMPATATEIAASMAGLASGADAFFFARLPASDVATAKILTEAGFAVIDTGMTFELVDYRAEPARDVTVGLVRPDQFVGVADIAHRAFRWSRFHLDPNIPIAVANHVKRRWIESYCQGRRGSGLYVAEIDWRPVGFLAVLESRAPGPSAATIDLIGVAPEYHGHGVGTALVAKFVGEWRGRTSALRVGTQAANIRSIRFYERLGFRAAESSFVFHAHYRAGALVAST